MHGDPGFVFRKRRVIASVVVVAVGTIAACLGPKLGSFEQEAVVCQSCSGGTVTITPQTPINTTGFVDITISPASGSASSYDRIDMINYSCPSVWAVMATLPGEVVRTCGGSGSMVPSGKAPEPPSGAGTADMCFDQTFTFRVSFTPTTAGSASCSLQLMGPGLSLPITVFGTGVAMPYAMSVTPKTLPFGDVVVGTSSTQTIDIQNTGTNALMVNSITINPQTGYQTVNLPNPNPIAPGQTVKANVTCNPMTANDFNSTLTVNAANVSAQTVNLSCSGIMSNIVVTPAPVDVTTRVGDSVTRNVTIQNTGGAPATLNSVTVNKTVANIPITLVNPPGAGTQLGSGSSVQFGVKFDPTEAQAFTELAKLHIVHDTTMTRDVKINGAALDTSISVFPDVVDFGAVCAGSPVTKDVSMKAGGAGDFQLQAVSTPQAPFAFAPKTPLNFPVMFRGNGGNTVDFVATINASVPADAVESQSMLTTDIPSDKMHALKLKAQVLQGGVGATPANLDFGGVPKNTLSSAMSAEVRNCSEAPLAITDVHIDGLNAADFSIVLPAEKLVTLQPHESVEYAIVMRSDKPGAKVASLVVTSATSESRVALLGTALGGSGGDDLGDVSYYGCKNCDAGGSAGLWTLAIYLGLRRRRRK